MTLKFQINYNFNNKITIINISKSIEFMILD